MELGCDGWNRTYVSELTGKGDRGYRALKNRLSVVLTGEKGFIS